MKIHELIWELRKIHGNDNRNNQNIKIKIVDRNGALITESVDVIFKEEYSDSDKNNRVKITGQYLEVRIK
jgi:hypothetical protein